MIFVQRDPSTGSGLVKYAGDAARVLKDGVVVKDWTTGGTIAGVPQGDGYTLEVRNGSAVTSDKLSVGIAISALGQSNMWIWFQNQTGVPANPQTYMLQADGSWGAVGGAAARTITSILAGATGAPVAIINSAVGSTALLADHDVGAGYWLDQTPGHLYDRAKTALAATGGRAELVLWAQGESEAGVATSTYANALTTMFQRVHQDFGNSRILMQELGPHDGPNGPNGNYYATVRAAQYQVAAALDYADMGSNVAEASLLSDGLHLDGASRSWSAAQIAYSYLDQLGLGSLVTRTRGTDGADVVRGGGGIDYVEGGAGADDIAGGDGNDLLSSGAGRDLLHGDAGNDILVGGADNDTLYGGVGDDVLGGGYGDDQLFGEDGNDELWGGSGNDTLDAGNGNNVLYGGIGNDRMIGGSGDDRLYGDDGDDNLQGGDGNDIIDGGTGANTVSGGAGRDTIYGAAADVISAGDDNDTIFLSAASVSVDGGAGTDTIRLMASMSFTSASTITNFETIQAANGIAVDFSGLAAGVKATSLSVAGGSVSIVGTAYTDILTGAAGIDTLSGGAGKDSLYGGTGDTLLGGDDNDFLQIDGVAAKVDGGAGTGDKLRVAGNLAIAPGSVVNVEAFELANGFAADFTGLGAKARITSLSIDGGSSAMMGTAYADTLVGGAGADTIIGGAGDVMTGGAGDDVIVVDGAPASVDGGAGTDTLRLSKSLKVAAGATVGIERYEVADGMTGDFSALAGPVDVTALGSASGGATIIGTAAADTLRGGAGRDTLSGGAGKDQLFGGTGDTLNGGSEDDTITIDGAPASIDGGAGMDVVRVTRSLAFAAGSLTGVEAVQVADGATADFSALSVGVSATSLSVAGSYGGLVGTAFADTLTGGAGNDTIAAGAGDIVAAGDGDDLVLASGAPTSVDGGAGTDTLRIVAGATFGPGSLANVERIEVADGASADFSALGTGVAATALSAAGGGGTMVGTAFADTLTGGAGRDTLSAGGGDDVIVVSATPASIDGGDGIDTLRIVGTVAIAPASLANVERIEVANGATADLSALGVGIAATSLSQSGGGATIIGTGQSDAFAGGSGADTLYAGGGDDLVSLGAAPTRADGGDGADTLRILADLAPVAGSITGFERVEVADHVAADLSALGSGVAVASLSAAGGGAAITGTAFADTLLGGAGADIVKAGDGDDLVLVAAGPVLVDGGAGNDTLRVVGTTAFGAGTIAGFERIEVADGAAADFSQIADPVTLVSLSAAGGCAAITGTASGDTIAGGAGADRILGGDGDDLVTLAATPALADGGAGTDTLRILATMTPAAGSITGFERIEVADGIAVDLSALGASVGVASLSAAGGGATITGTAFADTIAGGAGADRIAAGDGDDMVVVATNPALVDGGAGADTLRVTGSVAFAAGSVTGVERVEIADGVSVDLSALGSGLSIASLSAAGGGVTIAGSAGNDVIIGGGGPDRLAGGAGDDVIIVTTAPASVDGGSGSDVLRVAGTVGFAAGSVAGIERVEVADGGSADFSQAGVAIAATALSAAGGRATILGGSGVDTLTGGAGVDTLDGGGGSDLIAGGAGDTLRGGDGDDVLAIDGAPALVDGGAGTDLLRIGASVAFAAGGIANVEQIEVADGATADFSALGAPVTATAKSVAGGGAKVIGTAAADTLTGGAGADTLSGNAGADTLAGGAGDTLSGGADDDLLLVDGAPALADGGAGNDTLRVTGSVSFAANSIANVERIEVVDGAAADFSAAGAAVKVAAVSTAGGGARIVGSSQTDILTGGAGADTILTGLGKDSVYGGVGDTLIGGDDSNFFQVDGAPVLVDGGAGASDKLRVAGNVVFAANSIVNVELFEVASGASGDFSAIGKGLKVTSLSIPGGSAVITGTAFADTLTGGAGADALTGGTGDILTGGDGDDIIAVDGTARQIDAGAGADTLRLSKNAKIATGSVTGIERVEVANGTTADLTPLTAGVTAVGLSVAGGNVSIRGTSYADTLIGGAGNDTLFATAGDTVSGGDGTDGILLSGQPATIDGGAGTDTVRLTSNLALAAGSVLNVERFEVAAGVTGDLSALTDPVKAYSLSVAGGAATTITGTAQADNLTGGTGTDTLNGGAGADSFYAGVGDTLSGGADNDYFQVDGAPASIDGGSGTDKIRVMADITFAAGSVTNVESFEVANGASGNFAALGYAIRATSLSATGGTGVIVGGAQSDTLTGGAGADRLAGGAGNDVLTGGAGDDRFVFAPGSGADRINDFGTGSDQIDLTSYNFAASDTVAKTTSGSDLVLSMKGDTIRLSGFLSGHTASDLAEIRSNGAIVGYRLATAAAQLAAASAAFAPPSSSGMSATQSSLSGTPATTLANPIP